MIRKTINADRYAYIAGKLSCTAKYGGQAVILIAEGDADKVKAGDIVFGVATTHVFPVELTRRVDEGWSTYPQSHPGKVVYHYRRAFGHTDVDAMAAAVRRSKFVN